MMEDREVREKGKQKNYRKVSGRRAGLRYLAAFVILLILLCFLLVWNINSGSIELKVPDIIGILFLGEGDKRIETSFEHCEMTCFSLGSI